MRRVICAIALCLCYAVTGFAAEGKVVSVADGQAVVELAGTSLKKGAPVKLNGKAGKVIAVDGNKVTIKTANSADLKAGDAVKVDKSAALQGC